MDLRCGQNIDARTFAEIRRTMALDHQKWDAQVGDVAALAPFPIVLPKAAWRHLAALAADLARETVAIEDELARRPDLFSRLGLSARLSRALRPDPRAAPSPAAARIMRFDFHPTADGWRASEVNSDVCGGFTESSRFADLVAQATGDGIVPGDAGGAWTDAVARAAGRSARVVLLCAPGWLEDSQVVAHLAARLRARGVSADLASPLHLRWAGGHAHLGGAPAGAVLRFYQVEWLADLPDEASWMPLLRGGATPVTNPGRAALTETKRCALAWSEIDAPTDAWRRVLPETRDPRAARALWSGDWVIKPAFGNTGDDVTIRGHATRATWAKRVAAALARPRRWVAQRRFEVTPIDSPVGPVRPCVGVYVVDGRVAGVYGRVSPGAVIDFSALDAAVLIEN